MLDRAELQEIDNGVEALENDALVRECTMSFRGDHYEGCFTERGLYSHMKLCEELSKRLLAVDFLEQPIEAMEG
jgi:hypothetical protein